MNNHYTRINHELIILLNNYKLNIKEKFTLFENCFIFRNDKTTKNDLEDFMNSINKFQITYNDFRLQTYLSNTDKVYEPYFPLRRVIRYRSRLELLLFKKLCPEHNNAYKRNP